MIELLPSIVATAVADQHVRHADDSLGDFPQASQNGKSPLIDQLAQKRWTSPRASLLLLLGALCARAPAGTATRAG